MDKQIPVLYNRKEECCGCTACYAVCPKEAISMVEDSEGFLYPKVDEEKCIRCYKCLSVCAFKEAQREKGYLKD
ncbi:MAG: 4Fe-4S binding protein [Clostridiales bacterium]|nr:4Fe-4S binding protein [Clostridiales bacterium]